MEEGSEILVEDDFSVDMSYLSACENMWKGIRDVDNENIQVYNSVIESAEYGIYLESVPGFVCLYNKFINNFIGVAVGSPFEEAQRGMEIQRGQLWGNEFLRMGLCRIRILVNIIILPGQQQLMRLLLTKAMRLSIYLD